MNMESVLKAYRQDCLDCMSDADGRVSPDSIPWEWMRTLEALERAHRADSPDRADRLMKLEGD